MIRTTLPAGINPDLLIGADGLTTICYQAIDGRGFVVERFADPASREVLFTQPDAQGYGRLRSDGAAAFRGADSAAWGWFGGPLIRYGDTLGNYPIAFTEDLNCCVQMPPDFRVSLNGTSAVIGTGVGTGLARVTGTHATGYEIVTWDQDFYVNHLDTAHVLPSGDRVSQATNGGILCKFGAAEGTILPTENCYEPRLALQPNGAYTIIFGGRGPHGALPLTVLIDVTAADFVTEPPLPDIQPFTSAKIVAPYPAANGALTTHSAGMNSRVEFGQGLVAYPENTVIRPWIDLEQGGVLPSGECVTYCDISRVAAVAPMLKPWQVMAFNCYPNPGEAEHDFAIRILESLGDIPHSFILVASAWNRGGTLTDAEVLTGMEVVASIANDDHVADLCLGVAIFGLDRGTSLGQFKPLYQQCADLFSSPQGRPAFPVQLHPPIPPTPQGLAARKMLL